MSTHRVEFPRSAFAPLALPARANLSLHLTVLNSPVLFGCRSGLCGTCLVEVESLSAPPLAPPEATEREALSIYAPDNPRARLACQLCLTADIRLRKLTSV